LNREGSILYTEPRSARRVLSSHDIDLAVALGKQNSSTNAPERPWQEQQVVGIMHRAPMTVTPTTGVAVTAQVLVERGLIAACSGYESEQPSSQDTQQRYNLSSWVVDTASDLLMALARATGALSPACI